MILKVLTIISGIYIAILFLLGLVTSLAFSNQNIYSSIFSIIKTHIKNLPFSSNSPTYPTLHF
ncbi:Uncharacterised protein [Helicobacter muridarum]|uniref:Uncharacterized protein n=1 Tax=Helicobacter muridarum TaxID=216 RepID=A0A377PUC7_9HELI|nr:Uncharacterised protein [Helicobacter muridarum]